MEEQLGILFGLGAVGRVYDGGLVHMLQIQFVCQCKNLLLITYQDDIGQSVGQGMVGSGQCTFLETLGQNDALSVLLCPEDNLVH